MNLKINSQFTFGEVKISNNKIPKATTANKKDNQIAATLKVSKEAKQKSRIVEEAKAERKQAEATINGIIDTVRNGGNLTKDEQEIFERELKSMGIDYYKDKKDFKLNVNDASHLSALKENFMQRVDVYLGLQKEVKENAIDDSIDSDNVMLTMSKLENDEKKALIEALEESLESDEENEDISPDEESLDSDDSNSEETEGEITNAEVTTDIKAFEQIEKNKDSLKNIKMKSQSEGDKEREYDIALDNEFAKLIKTLDNEEISNEEKLEVFENFKTNAAEFSFNREVEKVKKIFDYETWITNKLESLQHDEIDEVKGKGNNLKSLISSEFAKSFFIK